MIRHIVITGALICSGLTVNADEIQDLKAKLGKAPNDSVKAELLSELIDALPEGEWHEYNSQLHSLAEKHIKNCKGSAECDHYKKHLANTLVNFGYIFSDQGLMDKSIENYLKGLRIYEELNDLSGIAETNNNIGFLFMQQNDLVKAEQFYRKALSSFKKLGNKEGIGSGYNNIGYILKNQLKYKEALSSYDSAMRFYQDTNDMDGIARSLNNSGKIHLILHDTVKAKDCYFRSLAFFHKIGNKEGVVFCQLNLGLIYRDQRKLDSALKYANSSYEMSVDLGYLTGLRDCAKLRYDIFKMMGKKESALDMYEVYIRMRDSIINEKNQVSVMEQQLKYDHEKEVLKLEKQQAIAEAEKKERALVIFGVIILLLIVSVFSVSLYKKFKLANAQRVIIGEQKEEVQKQKEIIEEKQKEIHDSINYAKRIQSSFMASEDQLEGRVDDYFILFNPKDVVSGDFYWADSSGKDLYICIADSTGHGIPGAFMSLLNISLLNEAVLSKHYTETNEVLDFVRKILILGLKPDESGQGGNDGMDCILIRLNLEKLQLQFSGANNPLWLLRDNDVISIDADKMAVGRSPKQDIPFTSKVYDLRKGDVLYMFTDGYPDQFGGPRGKKFKYKQMEEYLLSIHLLPMQEQRELLYKKFMDWKGDLEQVDDVCVIGIRI